MIMSPGSISAATWSTIRPVIAAGSISHTARGLASLPTNSSIEAAPTLPSLTRSATAPALMS